MLRGHWGWTGGGADTRSGRREEIGPGFRGSSLAALARGDTVITGVAHLRPKESDRLQAVAAELAKMSREARETADGLVIRGGAPKGAVIQTYNDHRIAMSFAVAGLKTPGVSITDPDCVAKSFPDFWEFFHRLYRQQ